MAIETVEPTCLETLPTEILHAVVGLLHPWQIKQLSCTSKRLRQACLSRLFRRVRFDFSRAGIERLEAFSKSNAVSHVASFTYTVTQVFKSGILDFDRSRSDILNPDDVGVCKTTRDTYEEQRSIVDEGADRILSFIFCKLPLLSEVRLCFGEALEGENCLLSSDVLFEDQFYLHHFQVATSAIQFAHRKGIGIDTVSLWGFNLPYFHSWEIPDLSILSESLRLLLDGVKILRLRGSKCVLELLSHCTLHLHQLDMCELTTADIALMDFLQANKETIRSVGFHEVNICASNPRVTSCQLMTASMLRSMLDLPQYSPCETIKCGCLPSGDEGSRLVIGESSDKLVEHSRTSIGRNLDYW